MDSYRRQQDRRQGPRDGGQQCCYVAFSPTGPKTFLSGQQLIIHHIIHNYHCHGPFDGVSGRGVNLHCVHQIVAAQLE